MFYNNLKTKADNLKAPKILVIGDFAIDEMIFGSTARISREAPVLILEHKDTKIILGTASNAANNISSINNGKVGAIGVVGADYYGPVLLKALEDAGIETKYMVMDKARKTTTKTRISGTCSQSITQQIVRIDRQTTDLISKETESQALQNIKEAILEYDGVIMSDYHLGFLTDNIIRETVALCKMYSKPLVVDAQKDFERYEGADVLTPNQPDTEAFLGYEIKDDETLKKAGEELTRRLNLRYLLMTRGEEGVALFERKGEEIECTKVPAFNKEEVFDVTGAGDTVAAVFTLALCSQMTPLECATLGNISAGIVIRGFGCHTTNIEEIKEEISGLKEKVWNF